MLKAVALACTRTWTHTLLLGAVSRLLFNSIQLGKNGFAKLPPESGIAHTQRGETKEEAHNERTLINTLICWTVFEKL